MPTLVALIDTGEPASSKVTLKFHKPVATVSISELRAAAREGRVEQLFREAAKKAEAHGRVLGIYLSGRGTRHLRRLFGLPRYVRMDGDGA